MSEELQLEDLETLAECVEFARVFSSYRGYKDFEGLAKKVDKAIKVESERRYALEVQHYERLGPKPSSK